jgi:hypothetical protein
MRPKGVIVYESAPNPIAEAAKQHQQELEAERRAAAEVRAARPLLNKHTYDWLYEEWKARVAAGGTRKMPKCRRCAAILHWDEPAHVCPGYIPDRTRLNMEISWEERKAMRRAAWEEAGDWDDDQFDPTTPEGADFAMHEAETGETRDQVVLEDMTEEEWLMRKFGYIP